MLAVDEWSSDGIILMRNYRSARRLRVEVELFKLERQFFFWNGIQGIQKDYNISF